MPDPPAPQYPDIDPKLTRNHEVVMRRVLDAFGLDAETKTPGREIVALKGKTLATRSWAQR